MENGKKRITLTGFMGVGKTTVARHLSYIVRAKTLDLDAYISEGENSSVPELFEKVGEQNFRKLETDYLKRAIAEDVDIISLGGGAWTVEGNREIIRENGLTSVWLETDFEHCWRNIKQSRYERPLAKNRKMARKLFDERVKFYCLSDWHFVIKAGNSSYDVAKQIAIEVFGELLR